MTRVFPIIVTLSIEFLPSALSWLRQRNPKALSLAPRVSAPLRCVRHCRISRRCIRKPATPSWVPRTRNGKAKRIPLGNGEWILAEASWVDSTRVWRLTTNATRYVTINGIRVDDRIQALIDNHYDIDFNEGDGEYAFELISPTFSFSLTTEERYAKAFYEVISHRTGHEKALEILNPTARITTITVSSDCGEPLK